jgi:hypothetical protein
VASIAPDVRERILTLLREGIGSDVIAEQLDVNVWVVRGLRAFLTRTDRPPGEPLPEDEVPTEAIGLKFGLERDLQRALRRSITEMDPSLRIIDGGKERQVEAGFIDILAEDDVGSVVIELKAGKSPDQAITQVLSYVGSLNKEDRTRNVRAVLVASDFGDRVKLAAAAAGVRLFQYSVRFDFTEI